MRYSTILYGTDGSPAAALAQPHAIALAQATGASLVGLIVVDEDLVFRLGIHRGEGEHELHDEAQQLLADLEVAAKQANVPFRARHVRGEPTNAICEVAAEEGADLIVIGTHGGGALANLLIGSVAESVIRKAGIPVLVVPWRPSQAT